MQLSAMPLSPFRFWALVPQPSSITSAVGGHGGPAPRPFEETRPHSACAQHQTHSPTFGGQLSRTGSTAGRGLPTGSARTQLSPAGKAVSASPVCEHKHLLGACSETPAQAVQLPASLFRSTIKAEGWLKANAPWEGKCRALYCGTHQHGSRSEEQGLAAGRKEASIRPVRVFAVRPLCS